jgi:hypothetical protein
MRRFSRKKRGGCRAVVTGLVVFLLPFFPLPAHEPRSQTRTHTLTYTHSFLLWFRSWHLFRPAPREHAWVCVRNGPFYLCSFCGPAAKEQTSKKKSAFYEKSPIVWIIRNTPSTLSAVGSHLCLNTPLPSFILPFLCYTSPPPLPTDTQPLFPPFLCVFAS